MSYKSCLKCRKITKHESGALDGKGKRVVVCTVCSTESAGASKRERAALEKQRLERFPEDEKFFNQVVDKINNPRIDIESERQE